MRTIEEMYEQYKKYGDEKDEAEYGIAILKKAIKDRRTEIAAEVLSAVNDQGKPLYSNDMKRSVEIDRRAMKDEKIEEWQEKIYELEKRKRWLDRAMEVLKWEIEARIRTPRVI